MTEESKPLLALSKYLELLARDNETVRNDLSTKEELIAKFGAANYAVFAVMLLVSAVIGLFFWWRGQKNTHEFLMASRSMGTVPMTLSLIASFMSAITLLGTPAEVHVKGTQYVFLVLSYPFVMASTAYLYLPIYSKINLTTSYEYLGIRFGKSVKLLCSACFVIQMVIYMAIVVYAPALALFQVTGFAVDIACVVIFIVCIFYTSLGGMKAVMWTDTFQATCMFGSFLAIIIKGNYDVGGANIVFDRNYQTGRVELFNFDTDMRMRHTVWSLIIGGYFTWISIYGINQTQVQRYLTVKKPSQAVKAIWWNVLGIGGLLLICAYGGMVMFAYYHDCDPRIMKQVSKNDQLFPMFVMQVMGDIPGIPGLFVAGVFSGALSTVSSGLNSLAAVCLRDFIEAGCGVELSERWATITSKLLAVVFGIIGYGIVFLVKYLPGVLEAALGIFGIMGGPVLGAFNLGIFFPFVNTRGAFVGTLSSLIFTMWMGFGQTVSKQYKAYNATRWAPSKPTRIDNCPISWYNSTYNITDDIFLMEEEDDISHMMASNLTTSATPGDDMTDSSAGFTHLALYDISYMWFSAIACLWCMVVGILVSLYEPQDHRKLDRRLISDSIPAFMSIYPPPIRNPVIKYFNQIGSEFDESLAVYAKKDDENEDANTNLGFMGDNPTKIALK